MLLTRAPLGPKTSFDLHVLRMPPAFVLSHNQTLKLSKKRHKVLNLRNDRLKRNTMYIYTLYINRHVFQKGRKY